MNLTTKHPAAIIDSDVVTLIPWTDHRKDAFGHDLRSAYVEQFWLGTLGPSTTWFLRHCAAVLEDTEDAAVSLRETACALGIGFEGGARSAMVKTVARACRFRAARAVGSTTLAVRLQLGVWRVFCVLAGQRGRGGQVFPLHRWLGCLVGRFR